MAVVEEGGEQTQTRWCQKMLTSQSHRYSNKHIKVKQPECHVVRILQHVTFSD